MEKLQVRSRDGLHLLHDHRVRKGLWMTPAGDRRGAAQSPAWSPRPIPPQFAGRPFTVAEAAALGVPATALRGRRFRAPFRGVRVPGTLPDTLATDAATLCLLLTGEWACSHGTAAALCDLPLPRGLDRRRPLHVTVLSWSAVKVALEYDGDVHRLRRDSWRNDIARKQILEDHGWGARGDRGRRPGAAP